MRTIIVTLVAVAAISSFGFAQDSKPTDKKPDYPIVVMKTSMGDIEIELFTDAAPKTVKNFLDLAEGRKETTDTTGAKVKKNFFDGLVFHRVIPGFMIQGGCPLGSGTGSPGYKFEDEISAKALGLDKKKAFNGERPARGLANNQREMSVILKPIYDELGITDQKSFEANKAEMMKRIAKMTFADAFTNMGYKYDNTLASRSAKRGVIAMANSGPNTNGSQFFINVGDTPHLDGKHTVFGHVVKGMDVVDKISKVKRGARDKPVEDVTIVSVREKKKVEKPASRKS